MRLDDSDISEFKSTYERDTGEHVTFDEAREAASRLYRLLEIFRDAIPGLTTDALANLRNLVNVKRRAATDRDQSSQ